MKHALRVIASLLVSAVFLLLAARGVSWAAVWSSLQSAHLVYLVPMAASSALPLYFRALRWRVLVTPLTPATVRTLFAATSIGFAANMLLPLRAGEVLRPWVLARKQGIGFAAVMATSALERLFDLAVLLCLFSVATLTLPLPPEWRRYGWVLLATFVVFLSALVALRQFPDRVSSVVASVLRPLPERFSHPLLEVVRRFEEGLASLGSVAAVVLATLYSLGVWFSISVCFGFGLSALDLPVPWFRGALATTTFVAIAVSIPGGPGFIGMFQAGCVVALGLYGVSSSLAFSYSVLTHLVQFASTVALGLYFFAREGVRLAEVRSIAEGEAPDALEEQKADASAPR